MADHASAPAADLSSSVPIGAEEVSASAWDRHQRISGLLVVLTVAFLPSVVSSLSGSYREPLANFSNAYIRHAYFNYLVTELSSLLLLAYVIRQNRQKLSDFGLMFRPQDIAYGILLWGAATVCYQLAYRPILSACELLGWHRTIPYVPASRLGLGMLGYCFVVVNPVYEEMIVRGFFMTEMIALTRSAALGIFASVVLQTSYHLYQGLPYALANGVVFLVFSVYYARARSIFPLIIAHFVMDFSYLLAQSRLLHGYS